MPILRAVTNLESFKTIDDLDGMWNILRPEISHRSSMKHFICLPHITDGYLYSIGGLLIKTSQTGWLCRRRSTFLPLGPVEYFLDKRNTKEGWDSSNSIRPSKSRMTGLGKCLKLRKGDAVSNTGFTRLGFTIALEDIFGNKELKLNIESMHRKSLLPSINPVNNIVIDRSKHPELATVQEIYLITHIEEVDRLELAGKIGPQARVFHVINKYPLFFTYQKFKLDEEGKAIHKVKCDPSEKRTKWIRGNTTDRLEGPWGPKWVHSKDDNGGGEHEAIN